MTEDRLSRLGPLAGVLFVVLELGGVAVGSAGHRAMVTLGDPTSKIVNAYARTVGTGVWVGAYMELASLAAFAVFAAWLFRSRRGTLSTAGLITAGVYIAVTVVGLVIGDVLEYQAGHALGAQQTLALFDLQAGLYTASWGIAAGFLALAPVGGWLRRSALAIAALSVIGMAMPKAAPGQFASFLFLIWVLVAGFVLARQPRALASSPPVAAHA